VEQLTKVDAATARELMDFSPKNTTRIMASGQAPGGEGARAPVSPPEPSPQVPASIPGAQAKLSEQQRGEIDALRRLVAMDEKDADNWDRLGKGLFLAGNYDEAVKCFHKSLELKPGIQEVVANLGVTLKTKGDMAQYQQVLDQLTALNPKMGEDLKNFAVPTKPANP
ncbi:MAG: tetratricopeptide repeat protein, partial [Verrucomicrobia bacterium]|nr:tetratricopeptide repeat protein [Verrucomicrobiota bacterium]